MKPYEQFEVDDFLQDDFFIEWVLYQSEASNSFWTGWLECNPSRQQIVEKAYKIIRGISVKPLSNELTDAHVRSMIDYVRVNGFEAGRSKSVIRPFYRAMWFRTAAVVLISLTITFLIHRQVNVDESVLRGSKESYIEISNRTNQSKLIRMDDGSLAILHPASVLRYPVHFSGPLRNVYLSGEAFFEVHKNPKNPFLVHSRDMVTRVLGTSFTVRAFKNNFKVIVNTGKVLVYSEKKKLQKSNLASVTLLPNQEVTFDHNRIKLVKDTLQSPLLLSKEVAKSSFTFSNTPLRQIISRLENAYSIHIEYDREKIGNEMLTASLSDLPLDEKVKLICKAINAQYSFEDGKIKILNP